MVNWRILPSEYLLPSRRFSPLHIIYVAFPPTLQYLPHPICQFGGHTFGVIEKKVFPNPASWRFVLLYWNCLWWNVTPLGMISVVFIITELTSLVTELRNLTYRLSPRITFNSLFFFFRLSYLLPYLLLLLFCSKLNNTLQLFWKSCFHITWSLLLLFLVIYHCYFFSDF